MERVGNPFLLVMLHCLRQDEYAFIVLIKITEQIDKKISSGLLSDRMRRKW